MIYYIAAVGEYDTAVSYSPDTVRVLWGILWHKNSTYAQMHGSQLLVIWSYSQVVMKKNSQNYDVPWGSYDVRSGNHWICAPRNKRSHSEITEDIWDMCLQKNEVKKSNYGTRASTFGSLSRHKYLVEMKKNPQNWTSYNMSEFSFCSLWCQD